MRTEMRQQFKRQTEKFKESASEDVQTKMNSAIEELEASDEERGLRVGEKAPNFNLLGASGETVDLYEQLSKGNVVLTFYRGGWCPYCNMELRAYQEIVGDIHNQGAELIAISPEVPDQSLTTQEKNNLKYYVLSDENNEVANQFNLVYQLPDYLIDVYKNRGNNLDKHNGDDTWMLPVPATYIINANGTIVFEYTKSDYKDRAEPSEVLEDLKRIK